ncbi:hypothetical protein JAO71_04180 [Olleya sp. YSTF-M6]|uniref:DUF6602 domain-containing protein n=1 Tax=Olleya sediminilitoris TaxID=2795739 RepID=A0ABS1WIR1_9FLAO|nr:DUF6602 domain-containing protein [Olleya sediminilitoris]MBL7558994.1 hypothetical protein [Olleya sediminilitoris]
MKWNDSLPNPDDWKPRIKKADSLQEAFYKKCSHIEKLIKIRAKLEAELDIDNYDSGPGIEDIIRNELIKIIPKRYAISKGVVNDSKGRTVGDCDLIIMNDTWFSAIKEGATKESRRYHFPIESIYSIIEVKKTLSYKSLDEALKKLVICKRLEREKVYEWNITENSHRKDKTYETYRNELFTGIIATELQEGITIDDIFKRFKQISKQIPKEDRIDSICVLGEGVSTWGFKPVKERYKNIRENGIRTTPIYIDEINELELYRYLTDEDGSSLVHFISNLLARMHHNILEAHYFWSKYGIKNFPMKKL